MKSLSQTVGFNTVLQMAGKVLVFLGQMGLFSMLTRYLGRELYGQFTTILTCVGMISLVADLGTSTVAVRELSAGRRSLNLILPQMVLLKVGLAILSSMVLAVILIFLPLTTPLKVLTLISSLSLLGQALSYNSLGLLFAARLENYRTLSVDLLALLVYTLLLLIGILCHRGLTWMIWAGVVQALLQSVLIFGWLRRERITWKWQVDWSYVWWLLRESFPLAVGGFFAVLYFKIDVLMLQGMTHDFQIVGIYNVGYKFIENSGFLNAALMATIFPVLSRAFAQDREHLGEIYQRCLNLLMVVSVAFGLFLYLFSAPLVLFLCGRDYLPSAAVLRIGAPAVALMFVNNLGAQLLFASGKQGLFAWFNFWGAVLKIGMNLVLIPWAGYQGAAWATLACEIYICACVFITIYRVHGWLPSFYRLSKLLSIGAVVGLGYYFLPDKSALWSLLGLSLGVGVALWVFSLVKIEDLLFIARQRVLP